MSTCEVLKEVVMKGERLQAPPFDFLRECTMALIHYARR